MATQPDQRGVVWRLLAGPVPARRSQAKLIACEDWPIALEFIDSRWKI